MAKFSHPLVSGQRSRVHDAWGSGAFGASRGHRKHRGLDIAAAPLEQVYAPFSGRIVREAFPYASDLSFRGVVLEGTGDWQGYTAKMFYVSGVICGEVAAGALIGFVQNLGVKYPDITNHVHIEVKKNNRTINPLEIWQMCF